MTFRTKVSFSHWWQILILFFIPITVIILYKVLAEGLPDYIAFSIYTVSILFPICGFVAISAVLKTDYKLEKTCLIINYNRETPVIIGYDKIDSIENQINKKKLYPEAVSYARSFDVIYIKYSDNTAKKVRIKISPYDKHNFIKTLSKNLEKTNSINSNTEENTKITDYEEFNQRNKNGGFKVNLPDDFFNGDE